MFARDTKTACTHDETGRQTVFDAILDAEPNHSTKGLVDEAFPLAIGGTETTVTTITCSLVHLEES
jgi:cytochrome P450